MIKVVCDSCLIEVKRHDGFVRVEHTFSYGSERDGDTVSLELCESCLEVLYENVKNLRKKDYRYEDEQ